MYVKQNAGRVARALFEVSQLGTVFKCKLGLYLSGDHLVLCRRHNDVDLTWFASVRVTCWFLWLQLCLTASPVLSSHLPLILHAFRPPFSSTLSPNLLRIAFQYSPMFCQSRSNLLPNPFRQIALKKGWAFLASRLLSYALMIDRQLWDFQHPLRQFKSLKPEIAMKLERSQVCSDVGCVCVCVVCQACCFSDLVILSDKPDTVAPETRQTQLMPSLSCAIVIGFTCDCFFLCSFLPSL